MNDDHHNNNNNPPKPIKIKRRHKSTIKKTKTIILSSENIDISSCKETKPQTKKKITNDDFSPILKNSSKHSVFQITHKKSMTKPTPNLQNPHQNPFTRLLLRVLLPNLVFWGVSVFILFMQVYIEDYCFVPDLCECVNIFIYIYTFLKECFYSYSIIVIISFYGAYYITRGFYQKYYFKNVYLTNILLLLLALYGMDYENRKEPILSLVKRRNVFCVIGLSSSYLLILAWAHKDFKPYFFKSLALITLFELLLFFNSFYFRSYFSLYVLDFIMKFYDKNLSMNLFKLFFLFSTVFYSILARHFCYIFYKKIIKEDALSLNIVIFFMKMVTIDVLSTKAFNILTSPLNEIYCWIHFAVYAYYIFSVYSRTNLLMDFIKFCISFLLKKKKKEEKNTEIHNGFRSLMSNCILEINLVMFFRIFTYRFSHHFVLFTKDTILYQDCALKESIDTFAIFDLNLIILFLTHGIILMGIMLFITKKKKGCFEIQVEDIHILARTFYFICFFSQVDWTLQLYKLFEQKV